MVAGVGNRRDLDVHGLQVRQAGERFEAAGHDCRMADLQASRIFGWPPTAARRPRITAASAWRGLPAPRRRWPSKTNFATLPAGRRFAPAPPRNRYRKRAEVVTLEGTAGTVPRVVQPEPAMGWDRTKRGNKERGYYYSVRLSHRPHPVKVYLGRGAEAEAEAARVAAKQAEQALAKQERAVELARQARLDVLVAEFDARVGAVAATWLHTKGFHHHKGSWRRRRGHRPNDE